MLYYRIKMFGLSISLGVISCGYPGIDFQALVEGFPEI